MLQDHHQFTDAAEIVSHYADLKKKFRSLQVIEKPVTQPVIESVRKILEVQDPRAEEERRMIEECRALTSHLKGSRINAIIKEVADKHGLMFSYMFVRARNAKLILARQEAFYRLRTELKLSFPRIGRIFHGMDHTTILHGVRKHEERMKDNG